MASRTMRGKSGSARSTLSGVMEIGTDIGELTA
jgi:hypothetical protein